jgi:endogenous inhibitor of DNA gyrase (YacG/DUF329 family)
MSAATLAAAIQRDLLRTEQPKTETPTCFACGRPMVERHNTDDDNVARFCSRRCRTAYDAGLPAHDPDQFRDLTRTFDTSHFRVVASTNTSGEISPVETYDPLAGSRQPSRGIKRRGSSGFVIACLGCDREFDSTGLRCCSTDCERRYLKRCENEQLMASVGMERPVKRKCEAPGCGRDIPNWRNGRRVSKATKFCSTRCKQAAYAKKATQVGDGPDDDSLRETAKIPA